MAQLETRLARVHAPLEERLQTYEKRIAELESDLGIARPDHGCPLPWARRGVLLLNAVLTVERGLAGSHHGKGWEAFTDAVVDHLNREREGLVFLLWGSPAQAKARQVDLQRHHVLKAPHPSPL